LGERDIGAMAQRCKHFFPQRPFFSVRRAEVVSAALRRGACPRSRRRRAQA
jgi:hypothetical protein